MDTVNYVTEQGAPVGGTSRKAILEAANRVGEASNDFLRYVMQDGEVVPIDVSAQDGNIVALTREERVYQVSTPFTLLVLKIYLPLLY